MVAAVCINAGLLLPTGVFPWLSFAKRECRLNLRVITTALEQYYAANRSYPPAFVADSNGRRLHSWRALLLPYLGEAELTRQYRFDEPWDSPGNFPLTRKRIKFFECPLHPGRCCYAAVVGEDTMWPGTRGRTQAEVAAPRDTLMLVERYSNQSWAAPNDPTLEEFLAEDASLALPTGHAAQRTEWTERGPGRGVSAVSGYSDHVRRKPSRDEWLAAFSVKPHDGRLGYLLSGEELLPFGIRWDVFVPQAALAILSMLPFVTLVKLARQQPI